MTFDALTKAIVDRFWNALPDAWRPTNPYEIYSPRVTAIRGVLQLALANVDSAWQAQIAELQEGSFEQRAIGQTRMNPERRVPQDGHEYAIEQWWKETLDREPSSLTFTSLNRLAELIFRVNPEVKRALLEAYPFVFLDEFQDTTYAQYGFLESVFSGSDTTVTAVGDDKQRIMTWAGAHPEAFDAFQKDFEAERVPLLINFRSSPALVHLQTVVGRAIDPNAPTPESKAPSHIDGDVAEIWRFPTDDNESEHVAEWLKNDMRDRGQMPRNYALLVRQKADDYEAQLKWNFNARGLGIRNESHSLGHTTLQDLLSEDVTALALSLLKLAVYRRDPDAWAIVNQALPVLRAFDNDNIAAQRTAQDELTSYIKHLRGTVEGAPDSKAVEGIVNSLFGFLGMDALLTATTRHQETEQLEIIVEAFKEHLTNCANESKDWAECIDLFEGTHSVPLMTVHKSKGLEYDTIIFLGLDDKNWWSFDRNVMEGRATFLVALSRAEQRVIFTYVEDRARSKINELYDLLREAGVPEKVIP